MPAAEKIPLSVLDLVPVRQGSSATEALQETVELARHVEKLGYRRYWFAEHHGMPGVASSSPAVLIAHVAALTSTLRVGSGGVMLPNHSALAIAEQFGTLEALHPGRIDLGIGRAPGTDGLTMKVLRRMQATPAEDEFPQQLAELLGFFRGNFPDDHPFQRIHATPAQGHEPPLWLLGSSGYSAELAGLMGLPFAFAHHFSSEATLPALKLYRRCFRPSGALKEPYAMVAVMGTVADSDEEALRLALPNALAFLRVRQGKPGLYPSVEEAQAHPWTREERAFADERNRQNLVGSPASVRKQLDSFLERTHADELMVLCAIPHAAARQRSYSLLRDLY